MGDYTSLTLALNFAQYISHCFPSEHLCGPHNFSIKDLNFTVMSESKFSLLQFFTVQLHLACISIAGCSGQADKFWISSLVVLFANCFSRMWPEVTHAEIPLYNRCTTLDLLTVSGSLSYTHSQLEGSWTREVHRKGHSIDQSPHLPK